MRFVLYKPTAKKRPLKCRIIKKIRSKITGAATTLLIELPRGKREEVARYYNPQVAVLVPENKIPKAWKNVLAANPKANLAVCYQDGQEHMTTLVCPRSLKQLKAVIKSEEIADVYLHRARGKAIGEGKPQVEECYTLYMVGNKQIEFPEEPEHYC